MIYLQTHSQANLINNKRIKVIEGIRLSKFLDDEDEIKATEIVKNFSKVSYKYEAHNNCFFII